MHSSQQDGKKNAKSFTNKEESDNDRNNNNVNIFTQQKETSNSQRNHVNFSRHHSVTAVSRGQVNAEEGIAGKKRRRKRITFKMDKNNLELGVE